MRKSKYPANGRLKGVSGKKFVRILKKTIGRISQSDLKIMAKAIEEGCERI